MQSLAVGKARSFIVSLLVSFFILGMVGGTSVMLTPSPALAQDDGPPPDDGPKTKEKVNPVVHFFVSIGIPFGLIFAAISIGMVALIIILLLDLRMGEAVPPAFVEEFTEMVNKRQFKQAYEMCRN